MRATTRRIVLPALLVLLIALRLHGGAGAYLLVATLLGVAGFLVRRRLADRRSLRAYRSWPCACGCGATISRPSRARYATPACRRLGLLRRHAASGDARAIAQLTRLAARPLEPASADDIPF